MKKLVQIGVLAVPLLSFTGCVAVKTTPPSRGMLHLESVTTNVVRTEVSEIEPAVAQANGVVNVKINLLGAFSRETTKVYASPAGNDEFLAIGFFPGVLSCKGEYGDCLQNGAGAFLYNLVFAGLPTVHGLLVEPCIPYSPQQTDSIVGKKAFLKSALIGFSQYSKPFPENRKAETSRSNFSKILLEDAFISAPGLGLESGRGQPLQIPADRLPPKGEVDVKLLLPEGHPLKGAMADFENIPIKVSCKK